MNRRTQRLLLFIPVVGLLLAGCANQSATSAASESVPDSTLESTSDSTSDSTGTATPAGLIQRVENKIAESLLTDLDSALARERDRPATTPQTQHDLVSTHWQRIDTSVDPSRVSAANQLAMALVRQLAAPQRQRQYAGLRQALAMELSSAQQIQRHLLKQLHGLQQQLAGSLDTPVDGLMQTLKEDRDSYLDNSNASRQLYLSKANDVMLAVIPTLPAIIGNRPLTPISIELMDSTTSYLQDIYAPARLSSSSSPGTSADARYAINPQTIYLVPAYELGARTCFFGVPGLHAIHADAIYPEIQSSDLTAPHRYGWSLYGLDQMSIHGFFDDKYANAGRLSFLISHYADAIVDIGIQHLNWSDDRASTFMNNNTLRVQQANRRIADHIRQHPGNALAPISGYLTIIQLEADSRMTLGTAFSQGAFNVQLIRSGPVSLTLMRDNVLQWQREIRRQHEIRANTQ